MYKQVIAVRTDLKMGKGKIAAQVAHASLCAYERSNIKIRYLWKKDGAKKVVVKVGSKEELLEIYKRAKKKKIPCCIVKDAGKTQIKEGEVTTVGIGPYKDKEIDEITGNLKLL